MPIVVVVLLAVAVGATACSEPEPKGAGATTTTAAGACSPDDLLACARRSSLGPLLPATPAPATGTPIRLGMVNQEQTPAGSYPELSAAVRTALRFVNDDLGGVDGRPLEVDVCDTDFSAEGSTTCGQRFVESGAVAVLGGIDVFGNAVDTLADNGVPYVGGIPVSTSSVTSPLSFQWSGGTWGAVVAFADHAARVVHAKDVSILYGDFGSIADAAQVGKAVLERAGVTVRLVPYPILSTDLSAPLAAATSDDPDAVFVLAADSACRAGLVGLAALDTTATRYFTGACAAPAITEQVGHEVTEGTIFNVEGTIDRAHPAPDQALYDAVVAAYADGAFDPVGAGTVTFRAVMNLYRALLGIDGEPTPAKVATALRAPGDTPSFNGHASRCDGEQFPDLPALCSPQQVLAVMHDGLLDQTGDWVDVGALARG